MWSWLSVLTVIVVVVIIIAAVAIILAMVAVVIIIIVVAAVVFIVGYCDAATAKTIIVVSAIGLWNAFDPLPWIWNALHARVSMRTLPVT